MPSVSIRYAEFYDVPRSFLFECGGKTYFFDCPFDAAADEYPSEYSVYEVPAQAGSPSWPDLASQGALIGRCLVAQVVFDQSRRKSVDSAILDLVA